MATTATNATTPTPGTGPDRAPARSSLRARWFARFWGLTNGSVDRMLGPAKRSLLTDLPDEVVEIGPGAGANFAYLRPGTRVIAFEPNPFFHDTLREAAAARGIELDLRATGLVGGGLDDESQEVVISTLVLCSVGDIGATLREIRRILRPGGSLLFIEHVAAPAGSRRARYQRLVRRPWRVLGDGCDSHPDTVERLAESGLQLRDAHRETIGSKLDPTNLTYWGRATKV